MQRRASFLGKFMVVDSFSIISLRASQAFGNRWSSAHWQKGESASSGGRGGKCFGKKNRGLPSRQFSFRLTSSENLRLTHLLPHPHSLPPPRLHCGLQSSSSSPACWTGPGASALAPGGGNPTGLWQKPGWRCWRCTAWAGRERRRSSGTKGWRCGQTSSRRRRPLLPWVSACLCPTRLRRSCRRRWTWPGSASSLCLQSSSAAR